MKRTLATVVGFAGLAAAAAVAAAPPASAVPPKTWHSCSEYFRPIADPQAWQGLNQPIVSPWGSAKVFCSFKVANGQLSGVIDAYQVDPAGKPHAVSQIGLGGNRWVWITNPF